MRRLLAGLGSPTFEISVYDTLFSLYKRINELLRGTNHKTH